jgi:hypothetical protein
LPSIVGALQKAIHDFMDHTIATDRDNSIVRLDIQFLGNVNSVTLIFRI